ncbi:MAG: asparagine synthase (glutamine-hydrolyzing) [SAR86 cluster bacterium]|jgi:asparagine synthase (glutamine-hydrolysing)|nr:asparagine synthase (glutamine-hydrolyzing) [SAR86 cluster bacterium]
MCGINGCLHRKNLSFSSEEFKTATNLLFKRGPDSSGITEEILDDYVLKFGHRRLSILGIDESGNQPMNSLGERFSIIYNGEIYNHNSLRKELNKNFDIKWHGNCDTETLVNLFEFDSIDNVLKKIEGMFSFAIYDRKKQHLTLTRDKSGEKPLYISTEKNFFGFASELSALKSVPSFNQSINKRSVEKYLQKNYIPSPHTIFNHSFKLPPGSCLTVDLNIFESKAFSSFEELISTKGVTYSKWWSLDELYLNKMKGDSIKDAEVIDHTSNLLERSVKNQLISDVPLGAFLSGGIDSSLVVAMMKKSGKEVKTYTVGFDFLDYDESVFAEKVASYLGCNHTTYQCSKQDVLDIIPSLPEAFNEPFADSSQIPTMLVSSLARKEVKVALSGDAGDEIFGGYNRYLLANKYWKYLKYVPSLVQRGSLDLLNIFPKKFLSLLFSITPVGKNLSGSPEVRLEKVITKLRSINNPASFYESMTTEWTNSSKIMKFEDAENFKHHDLFAKNSNLSFEEAMMHADFETYLPDDILCKVDRSSMFYSLETRAPFLSKELIEYAYSLPLKFKIRDGKTKWVLRKILAQHMPEDLFERPKQGFGIPISIWMRNELKDWVNDTLSQEASDKHGLFNFPMIQKLKDEHFSGQFNHEHKLWSIIQFNQWYENKI